MRRFIIYIVILIFISVPTIAINVIPQPYEYDINMSNQYLFNDSTAIICKQKTLIPIAEIFASTLRRSTGLHIPIVNRSQHPVYLAIDRSIKNKEGYRLNINSDGIEIYGASASGVYYGLQTLLQLLPPQVESESFVDGIVWSVPESYITDYPQFSYRGLHLDPCRHFMPLSFIKKQVDIISKFKLNRLHLHLTDDQLWTIEIKKYPKLTEVGSKRYEVDGTLYNGGFYTQEELRDLVEYASLRGVTIIPEIEMPGHAMAALASYPQYGCTGGPYKVRSVWGIEEHLFCAGNDSVFDFIEDVLAEVADIFPSKYVHIGGDECPTKYWKQCPKCQDRMKNENLKSEVELHGYFMRRVEKILHKLGKEMIGWDEILDGGVSKTATVMSWRGEKGGIKAANQGNKVIMTPSTVCYLDHYQGSKLFEPLAQGGYSTMESLYAWSPISRNIKSEYKDMILGAQGNVWTEYIYTGDHAEMMIYPRLISLAETLWSHPSSKDYEDFSSRVDSVLLRLELCDVNYHIPLPDGPQSQYIEFIDSIFVGLHNIRNYKMYYACNADSGFEEYKFPVRLDSTLDFYAYTVSPTGKHSDTIHVHYTCLNDYRASSKQESVCGLYRQRAYGSFKNAYGIDTVTFDKVELVDSLEYDPKSSYFNPWIDVYQGYISVDSTATYEITTDVEEIWIDGVRIINNNDLIKRCQRSRAEMCLEKGKHSLRLIYNNCVNHGFPAIWRKPEIYMRIKGNEKFHLVSKENFYR